MLRAEIHQAETFSKNNKLRQSLPMADTSTNFTTASTSPACSALDCEFHCCVGSSCGAGFMACNDTYVIALVAFAAVALCFALILLCWKITLSAEGLSQVSHVAFPSSESVVATFNPPARKLKKLPSYYADSSSVSEERESSVLPHGMLSRSDLHSQQQQNPGLAQTTTKVIVVGQKDGPEPLSEPEAPPPASELLQRPLEISPFSTMAKRAVPRTERSAACAEIDGSVFAAPRTTERVPVPIEPGAVNSQPLSRQQCGTSFVPVTPGRIAEPIPLLPREEATSQQQKLEEVPNIEHIEEAAMSPANRQSQPSSSKSPVTPVTFRVPGRPKNQRPSPPADVQPPAAEKETKPGMFFNFESSLPKPPGTPSENPNTDTIMELLPSEDARSHVGVIVLRDMIVVHPTPAESAAGTHKERGRQVRTRMSNKTVDEALEKETELFQHPTQGEKQAFQKRFVLPTFGGGAGKAAARTKAKAKWLKRSASDIDFPK